MNKRIISLLVSLSVLLGMVAFAEDSKTEEMSVTNQYEIDVLTDLGLLDCFRNIPSANDNVTRAEFISMVMHLLNEGSADNNYKISPFSDVNEKTMGFSYICAAYEANLIHGYNGTFSPEENIKYIDAVRILVDILNGGMVAEQKGGYPQGYMAIASDLEITDGVSANADHELTFGELSVLYLNALNTEMYGNTLKANSIELMRSDTTLLNEKRDIYYDRGILNANRHTTLTTVDGLGGDGAIKIGAHTYYMYESFLPEQYLGYFVEYYYNIETDEVFFIAPLEKKNEVIHVKDVDIQNFSFTDRQFVYVEEGTDRVKKKTIPVSATVIFNGKNKLNYTETDLNVKEGAVDLIDNNGDGNIDVVIVNSYSTYFVGSANPKDRILVDFYKITDENGNEQIHSVNLSDEILGRTIVIVDEESNVLYFEDIKKYDVISVLMSADGTYVRCIVSNKSIDSKISGVEEDEGRSYVTLSDGNRYIVRSEIQNRLRGIFITGADGTVYFDDDGRIAGFIPSSNVSKYGFYIRGIYDEVGDGYLIKLMDIDGNIETYQTTKKLKIDGVKVTDLTQLPTTSQVVIYVVNKDNQISSIDTEAKNMSSANSDSSLNSIYGTSYQTFNYYPAGKSFRGKLSMSDEIPIFVGPINPQGASSQDYSVKKASELSKTKYSVKAYNVSDESLKAEVIHIAQDSTVTDLSSNSSTGIIVKKQIGLNSDDEVVPLITFAGDEKVYEVDFAGDKNGTIAAKVDSLNVGDFVAYNKNGKDRITNIDYMLNINGDTSTSEDITTMLGTGVSYYSSMFNYQIGYIFHIEDGELGITQTYPTSRNIPSDLMIYGSNDKTEVYLVDTRERKTEVSKVSWNDLKDYLNYGTADFVIVDFGNMQLSQVVIYR